MSVKLQRLGFIILPFVTVSKRYSSAAASKPVPEFQNFKKDFLKAHEITAQASSFYKKVTFLAIIPIGIALYMGIKDESRVHHDVAPKFMEHFKQYPYLAIRRREFPWKDSNKTLFQAKVQFLPGVGFEKHDDENH